MCCVARSFSSCFYIMWADLRNKRDSRKKSAVMPTKSSELYPELGREKCISWGRKREGDLSRIERIAPSSLTDPNLQIGNLSFSPPVPDFARTHFHVTLKIFKH